MSDEKTNRDLLGEWLELGREVLSAYYPTAEFAAIVIELGKGIPAAQFVVTPVASADLLTAAQ